MIYEIIKRDAFQLEHGEHPENSLLIVLRGSFSLEIEGKSYFAKKDDIVYFPAGETFRRKVAEPLECIYIQFLSHHLNCSSGIIKPYDSVRAANSIKHLYLAITDENRDLIAHFLKDLFIKNPNDYVNKPTDRMLSSCIVFLNENYFQHITLELLAKKFFISKQALIKKFKKYMNETPIEYLNGLRIRQSKDFLINSDDSICTISEKCGFSDVHYFSSVFKKATGMSPKEYRKIVNL